MPTKPVVVGNLLGFNRKSRLRPHLVGKVPVFYEPE